MTSASTGAGGHRLRRELGLAQITASGVGIIIGAGIYVLLVAQTGSFAISGLIMLAIPLTMIGIFPGFWLLNLLGAGKVGAFENPIFFTATGAVSLVHSLSSDTIGADGKLGGTIVGAVFLVMGLPVLAVWLWSALSGLRGSERPVATWMI